MAAGDGASQAHGCDWRLRLQSIRKVAGTKVHAGSETAGKRGL